LRFGSHVLNGYQRGEIEAAHMRYCPTLPSQTGTPEQVNEINNLMAPQDGTFAPNVPASMTVNPLKNNECSGVPLHEGGGADGAPDDADVVKDMELTGRPDTPTIRGVV
jgi:hypothetical protein